MLKILKPSKCPNIWFFETVTRDSRTRCALQANQLIPIWDEENDCSSPFEFVEGDVDWNIQMDREMREKHPVGTVFATTSIFQSAGGANNDGKEFVGCTDKHDYIPVNDAPEHIKKAYQTFLTGGVPMIKPAGGKSDPVPTRTTAKKESKLDKMLKKYPVPKVEQDGYFVNEELWQLMLFTTMIEPDNTLVTGPSGTAKTEIIQYFGERIGKQVCTHDMSSMQDPVSGLLGVHRINKAGVSEFDRAPFSKDIEKDAIILLDELSRSPLTANNLLFPILDSRRELPMAYASSDMDQSIKVNPKVNIMATVNEGFNYTGTSNLDQALRERFFVLEVDYMPFENEIQVLKKRIGVTKKDATKIANMAHAIRQLEREGELSMGISTRHTLRMAKLINSGFTLEFSAIKVILSAFQKEEQEKVRDIISSC